MVKIYLAANCQVQSMHLLLQQMVPKAVIHSVNILEFPHLSKELLTTELRYVQESDFILIQKGGKGFLDPKILKEEFPKKTLVTSGLYFRGLHPDCCYVGNPEDRFQNPSLYHSVVILDAYLKGLPEKAAAQAFNLQNFERLELLNAWETSIHEMRERDQGCDISSADLIETYCREFPGFLTMNHPSLNFMYQYMLAIVKKLSLQVHSVNLAILHDPLTAEDVLPVHDFVADYYGLPYRTTQHWMIYHLGKKFLTKEDIVHRFYEEYRKVDFKKLKVHSPMDMIATIHTNPKLRHLIN